MHFPCRSFNTAHKLLLDYLKIFYYYLKCPQKSVLIHIQSVFQLSVFDWLQCCPKTLGHGNSPKTFFIFLKLSLNSSICSVLRSVVISWSDALQKDWPTNKVNNIKSVFLPLIFFRSNFMCFQEAFQTQWPLFMAEQLVKVKALGLLYNRMGNMSDSLWNQKKDRLFN